MAVLPSGKLLIKCGDGIILVDEYDLIDVDGINDGDILCSADFERQMMDIIRRHNDKYGTELNPVIFSLAEKDRQ